MQDENNICKYCGKLTHSFIDICEDCENILENSYEYEDYYIENNYDLDLNLNLNGEK